MKGITIISGPLSEEGKIRLAEFSRKREERLAKLAEDCKNSIIEKSPDGTIKITIPSIGVVTWATDVEDAQVAITEAVKCFEITSDKFGDGFETELDKIV